MLSISIYFTIKVLLLLLLSEQMNDLKASGALLKSLPSKDDLTAGTPTATDGHAHSNTYQ